MSHEHGRHKSLSNGMEIEPAHGSRHLKKHNNTIKKCILKPKLVLKKSINSSPVDNLSPNSESKRCLYKKITRLVKENRLLYARLEGAELDKDSLSVIKENDELLSKLKRKYQKLEQNYYEIQADYDKINILLAKRENEFRQLHVHLEQSTLLNRKLEQERSNFVTLIQKVKSKNSQLNEDVNLLKSLIYRLNIEIEKYQDKLRNSDQLTDNQTIVNIIDEVQMDFKNKNVFKSWGKVNIHALGPLLDAYQENINEKDELIQKYKKELDDFTGKLKKVITENEDLHIQLENFKEKYEKYINEVKCFEKDAAIVKHQNDLFTKYSALQKQKLQEIHILYEQKVESMSQDNNKLHKEYLICKTDLSNLKGKYEILNESYENLKNISENTMPVSVHNGAIEECKRLFEELKQQYGAEKKILNTRIKYLEEVKLDNEKKFITLIVERDQLKVQATNSEKNLKQTFCKLEHLQNLIHTMEISRDSFKHQLNKKTLYCGKLAKQQERLMAENDKLIHLLKEKETENENMQYLGNNIVQRMGTLKSQFKIVKEGAKEQLASVEKHIKNQQLGVDQMKTEYQRELKRLKRLLQQKEEMIQKLQREKCATKDSLELVWKAATNDGKKIKATLENANACI